MELSAEARQVLERVNLIADRYQMGGTIQLQHVDVSDIEFLIDQPSFSLGLVGLYMLSSLQEKLSLKGIWQTEHGSRRYLYFLINEYGFNVARGALAEAPIATDQMSRLDVYLRKLQSQVPSNDDQIEPNESTETTLIIHGTWAPTETWWKPGGDFWNYVNTHVTNLYGKSDYFHWSGRNKHLARIDGARRLVSWTKSRGFSSVNIIAHSHGGNVAIMAAQLGLNIGKLVTLGTPIRLEYIPYLRTIGRIDNVFSLDDAIQTPWGTIPSRRGEGRTWADSTRLRNHIATDNGCGLPPDHAELHTAETWKASGLNSIFTL